MALSKIEHIVFLMLENRSFDHMLGYLSREDTPNPLPVDGHHADDAWKDKTANFEAPGKQPEQIRRIAAGQKIDDPPHGFERVKQQIDTAPGLPGPRPMGGFVKTYVDGWLKDDKRRPADAGAVMGYYDGDAVWAYDFLARNYCVCDRWFTPLPAGTQPNRLMGMGGHTKIRKNRTLLPRHDLVYDWLKRNKVGWLVYRDGPLPFFALMPKWWDDIIGSMGETGRFRAFDRLRSDWASAPVPPVLFIEPAYSEMRGDKANDDHAPTRITGGQKLVADVYDILTSNPQRWAKTLLVITYDEHGGFFDHVPPLPIRKQVNAHLFESSGPRVPALLVSPFVDPGQVFHEQVDHTAFLALLAERFTPATPYSKEVGDRHASFPPFGKLSKALRGTARAGPPPELKRPAVQMIAAGVESATGIELAGLAGQDRAPDAGTPTAIAFDKAARKTAARRPDLLADRDWQDLSQYVATTAPPVPTPQDHIGDE